MARRLKVELLVSVYRLLFAGLVMLTCGGVLLAEIVSNASLLTPWLLRTVSRTA